MTPVRLELMLTTSRSAMLTVTAVDMVSFSPRIKVQVSNDLLSPKWPPNLRPLILLLIPALFAGGRWLLFLGDGVLPAPETSGIPVSSQYTISLTAVLGLSLSSSSIMIPSSLYSTSKRRVG